MQIRIHPVGEQDRTWIRSMLEENWGSADVITRGKLHHADQLDGYTARIDGEYVGLVTFRIENDECEMVTLNSLEEGIGIGTRLVRAVVEYARRAGCVRVWLITTNDNTPAMAFYQVQGFRMLRIHYDAIRESRRQKPEIPEYGIDSIPIRDEIEMEFRLK